MSTVEDLLPTNKKRHDMNLTINQRTNGYADQTPTPTRFIRNCEEVGLFQDLQNVNPFEETFRKAVEAVHQGETLVLGKSDDKNYVDDTLHTPNVFPLIHEVQIRKEVLVKPDTETKPTVTVKKPELPRKIRNYRKRKPEPAIVCQPTFVVPEKNITFMLPIPKSPTSSINFLSPKYFSVLSRNVKNSASKPSDGFKADGIKVDDKKSDLMEYNRLAQMRTRQKRKKYLEYLEISNKQLTEKLTTVEKRLKTVMDENVILKRKIALFEEKVSIGFDASTQTITKPLDKKIPGIQDHDYTTSTIEPEEKPEPGLIIKKPFKKRNLQPKLCISCNKNSI